MAEQQDYSQSISFDVDHNHMTRGIYKAQELEFNGVYLTTFDIRLRSPYREETLTQSQLHSLEHSISLALRETIAQEKYKDIEVTCLSGMLCLCGIYVCLASTKPINWTLFSDIMQEVVIRALRQPDVPARDKVRCGNAGSLCTKYDLDKVIKDIDRLLNHLTDFDSYGFIK